MVESDFSNDEILNFYCFDKFCNWVNCSVLSGNVIWNWLIRWFDRFSILYVDGFSFFENYVIWLLVFCIKIR